MEPFDSRISQWTRGSEQKQCSPGISQVTVSPDGAIYGCVEFFYRRQDALGTVDEWLHRETVKRFSQKRAKKPEECEECAFEWRCNNTCACVNLRGTGELNTPPESLCYTEQAAFVTIDDIAAQLFKEKIPGFVLRQYSQSYHMLSGVEAVIDKLGDATWPV
ncbi:MAG: SPASM domain-containing protein [Planctomycetota bacterium]|nr:SPASM domain-containing protein [Planctomycetota bacterium]